MLVQDIMTRNPVSVFPETLVTEAQAIMKREKIHRLPVVDRDFRLQGMVSVRDLLSVSPSAASTLDMYEVTALLAKIKVSKVMTKKVISVPETMVVEEAARLMADNDIGGLPVLNKAGALSGIVTESDLFRLFIDMFGARRKGVRASFLAPQRRGELADMARTVTEAGGDILSFGTAPGTEPSNVHCVMKVDSLSIEAVEAALVPWVIKILDVREI